jgi:hypothetical protein
MSVNVKKKKILGVCYTSVEQSLFIWLVDGGDVFWEKNIVVFLVVTGFLREKCTTG